MAADGSPPPDVPHWVADLYALVDAGELDRYLEEYYADDAELQFASGPTLRGKAALREALGRGHDAHAMRHTFRNVWESGDTTIVEFDVSYTFRDGNVLDTHSLAILEREGDRVRALRVYLDHGPVLTMIQAAAAVSP
jgi:ketosteroid isomerase-like protein